VKSLEKANNDFKELIKGDRVRLLTNHSKMFSDFLFNLVITDVEWLHEDDDYNFDYEFTVEMGEEIYVFYHYEDELECTETSEEANVWDRMTTEEYEYFQKKVNELTLTDYIDAVKQEKNHKLAEMLTKSYGETKLLNVSYEKGMFTLHFENGKSIKTDRFFGL